MKTMRQLNRDLKAIAGRITRDDAVGKDPDPGDLMALRDTVDAILERLKAKP